MQCPGLDPGEEECDEGSKGINEQASYAATKLRQLYDKLEYKRQALGSIQNAPKPDKKVRLLAPRSLETFSPPVIGPHLVVKSAGEPLTSGTSLPSTGLEMQQHFTFLQQQNLDALGPTAPQIPRSF